MKKVRIDQLKLTKMVKKIPKLTKEWSEEDKTPVKWNFKTLDEFFIYVET